MTKHESLLDDYIQELMEKVDRQELTPGDMYRECERLGYFKAEEPPKGWLAKLRDMVLK
jgi:hypothetical protein